MTVDIEYTRGTQVSCPGIRLLQLHCRVCHNFILNPLIAIYLILYGLTLSRSVGEGCARLPMIHILYGLTLSRSVGEGCARLPMIHILYGLTLSRSVGEGCARLPMIHILYGLTLSRSVGEGCARLPMIHILCMFHALKPENTPLKTTLVMHENDLKMPSLSI